MKTIHAENLQESFYNIMKALKMEGSSVEVRGKNTLEIHPCFIHISNPLKRTLLYPKRGNNPFATLAETIWVLAGRNDMEFLTYFLPRAKDFSDDGRVWRAGYGPRIRNWEVLGPNWVDQIQYVVKQLKKDPSSRQAVISIWDPASECRVESTKDYPCCNWVHFMIRDKKLDCTLTMRSNDAVWGYSSINVYEWTVLQELIAEELNIRVGNYYHLSDSMHVYATHYGKMDEFIENYIPLKDLTQFRFWYNNSVLCLDLILTMYSEICENIIFNRGCVGYDERMKTIACSSSHMGSIIELLDVYLDLSKKEYTEDMFLEKIKNVPFTDLKVSCFYWFLKNILREKEGGEKMIDYCITKCS